MATKAQVRVTIEDLATGEKETRDISDDYILIEVGSAYLAHIQTYANGTHVLTVKGRRVEAGEGRE